MRKLIVLLVVIFSWQYGSAQVSKLRASTPKGINSIKGDYFFDHHNYIKAVEHYEESAKKNPKDFHSLLRIAESYYKSDQYQTAGDWYQRALDLDPKIEEKYILNYMLTLFKNAEYEALDKWLNIYNERVSKANLSNDGANNLYKDSILVFTNNLNTLNSKNSDISPNYFNNQLYFSSDRSVKQYDFNQGDYNIFRATPSSNGKAERFEPLNKNINSDSNEGSISIAQQSGQFFFTREEQLSGSNESIMNVFYYDIANSLSDEVNFTQVDLKKFDNNIGQPAVNSNGTVLIFASKNVANNNSYDLYKCEYSGKKWSKPEALNNIINTSKDEMYPYLHNDSILYFSSNGHGGLGGFDIYKVNLQKSDDQAEHLDSPINTSSDDFGFFLQGDTGYGYLSSDRPGGLGKEDLYQVYIQNIQTKTQIPDLGPKHVSLPIYSSGGDVVTLSGNDAGSMEFEFVPEVEYTLFINKDNYKDKSGGPRETNISENVIALTNIYTFHVQKMVENFNLETGETNRLEDIHINPGDLVTFKFIPKVEAFLDTVESRIRVGNREVRINARDTLVFGYVAEEAIKPSSLADSKITEEVVARNGEELLADNNKGDSESLIKTDLIAQINSEENVIEVDTVKLTDEMSMEVTQTEIDNNMDEYLEDNLVDDSSNIIAKTNPALDLESQTSEVQEAVTDFENSIMDSDSLAILAKVEPSEILDVTDDTKQPIEEDVEAINIAQADSTDMTNAASDLEKPLEVGEPQSMLAEFKTSKAMDSTNISEQIIKEIDGSKNIAQAESTDVTSSAKDLEKPLEASDSTTIIADVGTSDKPETEEQQIVKNNVVEDISPSDKLAIRKKEGDENIQFRVQIAAARTLISNEHLKRIYGGSKGVNTFEEDNYFKYYIAETSSYSTAKSVLRECGVDGAFIVAYKGNTKLKLQQAIAFQKQYAGLTTHPDPVLESNQGAELPKPVETDKINKEEISLNEEESQELVQPNEQALDKAGIGNEIAIVTKEDSILEDTTDSVLITQAQPIQEEMKTDSIAIGEEETQVIAQIDEPENSEIKIETETEVVAMEDSTHFDMADSVLVTQFQPTSEELKVDTVVIVEKEAQAIAQDDQPIDTELKMVDEMVMEDSTQIVITDSILVAQVPPPKEEIEPDTIAIDEEATQVIAQVGQPEDSEVKNTDEVSKGKNEDTIANDDSDNNEDDNKAADPSIASSSVLPSFTGVNENSNFLYRLQIAASKTPIRDAELKRMYSGPYTINYFKEEGYFKYYIAEAPSYFVAKRILNESGVNGFISVHKGNEKWQLKDALALQYKKPTQKDQLAESDSIIKIITVNFEFDEFTLPNNELLTLQKNVIDKLSTNNLFYAIVNGYTDIRGSGTYNYGLSQERASFVQRFVIKEGINSERVKTRYFGESQLIKYCPDDGNCDETIHQANRRVEILLLIKK